MLAPAVGGRSSWIPAPGDPSRLFGADVSIGNHHGFSPEPDTESVSSIELNKKENFATWISDVIRFNDLDPNGHVNNVAVCTFFEDGRVMFRDRHFKSQVENVLTGFVLARYLIEYHRPLEFPGEVDVGTTIIRIGRSSYTFGQAVFRGQECAATAEAVQVRVDPKTGRSVPLSDEFKAILESLALPAAKK
jgi:acyl-CoA thioester hydrolase